MTLLERLYSDLLLAKKTLDSSGDLIGIMTMANAHVSVAIDSCQKLLNETAKTRGEEARAKLKA